MIAKKQFKSKMIDDVLVAKSSQWYSKLKRITNYEKREAEYVQVEEISQLSNNAQAEAIANNFSEISNQYLPLQRGQIETPFIPSNSIPKFTPSKVRTYLQTMKTNKASPPGDIPAKIIKEFALFLSIPVADIINSGICLGEWPKIYKHEINDKNTALNSGINQKILEDKNKDYITLKPGQMSLHDANLVHGSEKNNQKRKEIGC